LNFVYNQKSLELLAQGIMTVNELTIST